MSELDLDGYMKPAIVLCSSSCCKHNDNTGYYNLCKHPCNVNKPSYGGITRYYVSECKLKEKE